MLTIVRKIIPKKIFRTLQPLYHLSLAYLGTFLFRFPSQKLFIIGVTGTKGKSSVTEIIHAILTEAKYKTALSNTIRFKTESGSTPNLYKMSMPGRFFMQRFLRTALDSGCTHAVIEITSEGARQFRHRGIALDVLVFNNLSPEHIESHGSFEKYRDAKRSIGKSLAASTKKETWICANSDDPESKFYLSLPVTHKKSFSIKDAESYVLHPNDIEFTYMGMRMTAPLTGLFNIYNVLAAITTTHSIGVSLEIIQSALKKLPQIQGRVERIEKGQPFTVIVDYAHTADSLEKLYQAFPNNRKICVLGNTGGGRDTWKRKEMGLIADTYCDHIILTDEDPYDDDPQKILEDMRVGITQKPCDIILDRRSAIAHALSTAKAADVVLITGKGTDPYIMGPRGTKIPWSDKTVATEELEKIL